MPLEWIKKNETTERTSCNRWEVQKLWNLIGDEVFLLSHPDGFGQDVSSLNEAKAIAIEMDDQYSQLFWLGE